MISGVLCVLLGEALLFGSTAVLAWFAFVFAINAVYFPLVEEPGLQAALRRRLRGLPRRRTALAAAAASLEPALNDNGPPDRRAVPTSVVLAA